MSKQGYCNLWSSDLKFNELLYTCPSMNGQTGFCANTCLIPKIYGYEQRGKNSSIQKTGLEKWITQAMIVGIGVGYKTRF